MLSQHLPGAERPIQAIPIQGESVAFCPIRTGKLLPLPCCRPAKGSTDDPGEFGGRGGETYPKSNASVRGRSLNKRLFSPVHKKDQNEPPGRRKCVTTQRNTHMLNTQYVLTSGCVFQGPEACLQEAKSGQAGALFIFASQICANSDAQ